jgi:hypothetical protein
MQLVVQGTVQGELCQETAVACKHCCYWGLISGVSMSREICLSKRSWQAGDMACKGYSHRAWGLRRFGCMMPPSNHTAEAVSSGMRYGGWLLHLAAKLQP